MCAIAEEDDHYTIAPGIADNFINLLYTVAGSRDPGSWRYPDELGEDLARNLQERAFHLRLFLDFCSGLGEAPSVVPELLQKTHTFIRLEEEWKLCESTAETNGWDLYPPRSSISAEPFIPSEKPLQQEENHTPLIVGGVLVLLAVAIYSYE